MPNALMDMGNTANTADYYKYKNACRNVGVIPLDMKTWAASGAPLAPTGSEASR